MKELYSKLGALLGFLVIILYALENASVLFGFATPETELVLGYFSVFQQYLVYALAGLAGLELVAGKKLLAYVFFIILAFVVVSTFFPSVLSGITG